MKNINFVHVIKIKGRAYNYFRPPAGMQADGQKRRRLNDDPDQAAREARRIVDRWQRGEARRERLLEQRRRSDLELHARDLAAAARARARALKLPCDLTAEFIIETLRRHDYRCAFSGVKLAMTASAKLKGRRNPWRPSLDRIDASLGYIQPNVRLVCVAVNIALSDWGDEVFRHILASAAENVSSTHRL